ncbi:MAG: hypothetical protein V4732_22430 [Pseudomonadota bacterium]
MNLEALKEICKNNPEILEKSALDNGSDPDTVKGIALFAIGNGYDSLSVNQKYHFDKSIRKLIENVQCDGYTHELEEEHTDCPAILNDENLVEYYQNDGGYCERCQGQADSDAHSRAAFFED